MEFSDYVSIAALIVSLASTGFSAWSGMRDRARLRATCEFLPATYDEDGPSGPPILRIEIANYGRRDVYLEYLYFQYGRQGRMSIAETTWESDIHGRCRLGEGDKYVHVLDPDMDSIVRDENGAEATNILFQDSLNRRYFVKDAGKNLRAYLDAARDY